MKKYFKNIELKIKFMFRNDDTLTSPINFFIQFRTSNRCLKKLYSLMNENYSENMLRLHFIIITYITFFISYVDSESRLKVNNLT